MTDSRLFPLTLDDLDSVAALQPEGWGDVVAFFRYQVNAPFCFPMKLSADGIIAGAGSYIRYGATVWLAMIMVHPAYRNRGIGTIVTQGLLDEAARLGYQTILLDATDLGYHVYKKLGFETVSTYIHMEGLPVSPEEPQSGIVPLDHRYEDMIARLDGLATAEQRDGLLADMLPGSLMYMSAEGAVEGIYMPGFGRKAIIAGTHEAGIALLKRRISTESTAMFPEANQVAFELLGNNGYRVTRTSKRMLLGKAVNWRPEYIYNTTGGAFG